MAVVDAEECGGPRVGSRLHGDGAYVANRQHLLLLLVEVQRALLPEPVGGEHRGEARRQQLTEAEDAAQRARRRGFGADADGGGQCVDGCVYVCRQEFAHGVVGEGLFYALLGGFSIVLCVSLMALL